MQENYDNTANNLFFSSGCDSSIFLNERDSLFSFLIHRGWKNNVHIVCVAVKWAVFIQSTSLKCKNQQVKCTRHLAAGS